MVSYKHHPFQSHNINLVLNYFGGDDDDLIKVIMDLIKLLHNSLDYLVTKSISIYTH